MLVAAPDWLPDMDAWYSGLLPYYLLLPAQIALLMVMAVVAWNRRVRTGRFRARESAHGAGALRIFAVLYFLGDGACGSASTSSDNGADFWREGAIPVAFHWVLALFMLVSGARLNQRWGCVRMPAEHQHQDDEADDVPHGDVPALAQPLAYGLGFGEQVRYGDAG